MSEKLKNFYITTAIDYPSGTPHMGHAYEKIISDCYARWYSLLGQDVFFLTGTDENGQKLVETAQKAGEETKVYIGKQVEKFKTLCSKLEIQNNDFIRTTEDRHTKCVEHFWTTLKEKGDIYQGHYEGWYCIDCEDFYTDTQAPDKICPNHNKELEHKKEDGYFFKLSKYNDFVLDFVKNNEKFITPKKAHKEVLSRLEGDKLRDIAISRPNVGWGVPVPGDDQYVVYTWFDALINYYALTHKSDHAHLWPANMHVIGKDIIWFHCVIWPAMLEAMSLAKPEQIYVHGMILGEDGRKMSKSLGNGVDPNTVLENYPLESFKYYLLRYIPSGNDGKFSLKELKDKHNNELGNDLGNLIMRVVKLSLKNLDPKFEAKNHTREINFDQTVTEISAFMDGREHTKALDLLWDCVNQLNQYVNNSEPWKLKEEKDKLESVIYNCLHGIHFCAYYLSAFLPNSCKSILNDIGVDEDQAPVFAEVSFNLSVPEALFPKLED